MDIVVFSLAALAAILALTALAVPLSRAGGLPLPVMLAAFGLGYGILTSGFGFSGAEGVLSYYDLWFVEQIALDTGTMLIVFLPPLLFEMAMAVNVRRLLGDLPVVIVMAVLAVVATTAAVGLAVWLVSPVPVVACLLLGAAVATTDPGAVISTFREIGAPRRLLVILEGESLLNDAAAIAIFAMLAGLLTAGTEPSAAGLVLGFLYDFGAGAGCGVLIAALAARLYPLLGRSILAEASLTVAVAYGAWIVAEQVAGASGVVSVVLAGLATSSVGVIRMGPGNWPVVRAVWAQAGFWANALILVLVSSLTPGLLLTLEWHEALITAAIYGGALVARAAILFGLLPLMDRLGLAAPLLPRQKLLVLWGGVRGPVTLVLALSLSDMASLGETGRLLAALAAAYTVTTLFLNAATLGLATRLLGLDRLSPGDLALRERIVAGSIERVRAVVSDLARRRDMEAEALAAVEAALGAQRQEAEAQADADAQGERIAFGERLRLGLAIVSGQELRLIRRAFEEGAIGPRATATLRGVAERLADAARTGGRAGYEAAARAGTGPSRAYRVAVFLHRYLQLDRPLREEIELQMTKLIETERILRDLAGFGARTLPPMIGPEAAANLAALIAARTEAVAAEFDAISAQYPRYARALEQVLIMRTAIRRERQQFQRLLNDGVIGQELHDDLARALDRRERVAARPPRLDFSLTPRILVDRMPFFAGLDARQRTMIARRLRTRFTTPGQTVLMRGDRGSEMYFIASGVMHVLDPGGRAGETAVLTSGDFFGELAILRPKMRRRSTIVSMGYCRLLELSRRDFEQLGRKAPAIEAMIRQAAMRQLNHGFGSGVPGNDLPEARDAAQ